jgi:glycosyltransferase involved in cell wall biosynthesis
MPHTGPYLAHPAAPGKAWKHASPDGKGPGNVTGTVRVLHVVVGGDIGGAERLLVDLATRPEQTAASHEVALFTPNPALAAFFAQSGLVVHDRGRVRENPLAYLRRSLGPGDVAWLAERIAERRTSIVHTHTFGSHVLGTRAAARTGRPQLRTEHHVMHYFDASSSPFTRWAAARTDRFVAVSRYVHRVLAETAPAVAAKATVVRNGIDAGRFAPRAPGEASSLPPASGRFRVGVVCRLTGWKRVHLAIEAAAIAGVELLVVGDGEDRHKLEALARRTEAAVTFLGHQSDPRPFVAACDVLLSTAVDEPLGLSVLEALSMGRPVIAFDGGGIPEIVAQDETGWLVREATAAALASAIARARAEPGKLRAMGIRGRQFVLDEATIERTCEGYAAVYRAMSPA